MYRKWKEIELCWFGNLQEMEGNRIVLVLNLPRMEGNRVVLVSKCTESGRKKYCVGLGMYREWKDIKLCWFGDVKEMEGNRFVLVWGCTENGRK
jgi:hypothetical protein